MKSLFVNLIPENWLHAIGAALFHSLWIGVVLSVVTALVLSLSRKSSSALRYQLLVGCLFMFVAGVAASFVYELNHTANSIVTEVVVGQENSQPTVTPLATATAPATPFDFKINGLMDLWNSYSAQIVMIWFLIICAKSIHLWVGLSGIAFLKKNQTYDPGKFWEVKVVELGHKLGMTKGIKLLQSGIAKVPMVVGHFKPVILLPLGLINGLSTAEVEAILAHELAHVKRRDYLVNLVQNLLEIVFFFNPAVLWMSKLIRTEREHCCDDLALQCVGDKKNYVNALLYCQEFQANAPAYAMAITGGKNQLLNRVRRMLFDTRTTLNRMEKAVLTVALVSIFVFSAAFTKVHSAIATGSLSNLSVFQDKPKKQASSTKKNKPKSKTKPVGKLVATVPSVAAPNQVVVRDMAQEVPVEDKARYIADSLYHEKYNKLYEKHNKLYEKHQLQYFQSNEDFKRAQQDYNKEQKRYFLEQQKYEISQQQFEQGEKLRRENQRIADSLKRLHKLNFRLDSARRKLQPISKPLNRSLNPLKPISAKSIPPAPSASPTVTSSTSSTSSTSVNTTKESISLTNGGELTGKSFSDMVNNELIKDGIIKNTKGLSYRLDANNFILNGNKLDVQVHEKYKAKYLKRPGTALLYNYEVSSN